MPNRILQIQNLEIDSRRAEAYADLLGNAAGNEGRPLSVEERETLQAKVVSETSEVVQSLMWHLLVTVLDPSAGAKEIALEHLADLRERNRGDALLYLRTHCAESMADIFAQYRNDPDEGVIYQLSEYLTHSDMEEAVNMKIRLLPYAKEHEIGDALRLEISEEGTYKNLIYLRERVAAGEATLAPLAETLVARLYGLG